MNRSNFCDYNTFLRQAPMTITQYMDNAPEHFSIDQKLKFAQCCVEDYKCGIINNIGSDIILGFEKLSEELKCLKQ